MISTTSSTRTRLALGLLLAAVLLVPAIALGGGGKAKLVAKDAGSGKSAVAVATATVHNPGKLSLKISSKPANKKVAWSFTTDCQKNGEVVRYPPPGEHADKVGRSKIQAGIKTAVSDADLCRVAVSAKLDYKSGKRVVAKIFNKG